MIALYILYAVLAIIALLLGIAIIRAILFVPQKDEQIEIEQISVNVDKAADDLSEMIKCKTISHRDREKENEAEFERFIKLLNERFPLIYKNCTFERVSDRAILYHLKGRSSQNPSVFTAHFDVVDVEEKVSVIIEKKEVKKEVKVEKKETPKPEEKNYMPIYSQEELDALDAEEEEYEEDTYDYDEYDDDSYYE